MRSLSACQNSTVTDSTAYTCQLVETRSGSATSLSWDTTVWF